MPLLPFSLSFYTPSFDAFDIFRRHAISMPLMRLFDAAFFADYFLR
jgi:hypothetical protein